MRRRNLYRRNRTLRGKVKSMDHPGEGSCHYTECTCDRFPSQDIPSLHPQDRDACNSWRRPRNCRRNKRIRSWNMACSQSIVTHPGSQSSSQIRTVGCNWPLLLPTPSHRRRTPCRCMECWRSRGDFRGNLQTNHSGRDPHTRSKLHRTTSRNRKILEAPSESGQASAWAPRSSRLHCKACKRNNPRHWGNRCSGQICKEGCTSPWPRRS